MYYIICVRNNGWAMYDNVLFWAQGSNGYTLDIRKAGLFTKEEAVSKCEAGDVYIKAHKLLIPKEVFDIKSFDIEIKVKKSESICKYVNTFKDIQNNKRTMKYGE